MNLTAISLIIFSLFSHDLFSQVRPGCEPPMSGENFKALVEEVKQSHFPSLKEVKLSVSTFSSDAYFLQAQPIVISLLGLRSKRRYQVQLNTKLLECPPTISALEAILVHELEHVVDYLPMSTSKVAAHGLRYVLSKKFKRHYERSTDCKVLDRGFHQGLADYRKWVYQWLDPEELSTKRRLYLTPEEIEIFQSSGICRP
jgi:hypothetical protein